VEGEGAVFNAARTAGTPGFSHPSLGAKEGATSFITCLFPPLTPLTTASVFNSWHLLLGRKGLRKTVISSCHPDSPLQFLHLFFLCPKSPPPPPPHHLFFRHPHPPQWSLPLLTGAGEGGSEAGPERVRGAGLQCRFPWYREEQSPLPPQPCGWTPSLTRGLPDPGNQAQVRPLSSHLYPAPGRSILV
jgi:hypothetical protein